MRFTLTVAMCPAAEFLPLAQAAEDCGFGGVAVPDSVFYPEQVSADYPYTSDGSRFWTPETPFVDPLVAIPAMAAATEDLRFVTNVMKLPLRHPVLVAKSVGSLCEMFPDRFALGVGLSWIPEEFEWLGLDMSTRGKRLDESIDVLRSLLHRGWVRHEGSMFNAGPLTMSPSPEGPPPILVGGHSAPALKRAVRTGDGWVSAMVDEAQAAELVGALHAQLDEAGRSKEEFEIVLTPTILPSAEGYRRFEELGATELIVGPWFFYGGSTLAEKLAAIERFGAEVIGPYQA